MQVRKATHSSRGISTELCKLDTQALLIRHEPCRMPVSGNSLPARSRSPETLLGQLEALYSQILQKKVSKEWGKNEPKKKKTNVLNQNEK